MRIWVLFSARGFCNELSVRAFDDKKEAAEFVENHEYYAEIKTKTEALKENSFGYYIYDNQQVLLV